MSREDVTRNCHEKLSQNSRSDSMFLWFSFFVWWRKTDEDCELAGEVNQRNVNVKSCCGESALGLMNFTAQCFGYKRVALPHHAIRLFESGLGMYFCWNLKQVLRHTILSGLMSVRRHTLLTLSNELYFETQMIIFLNHILKGEKNLGESHQTRDKTFKRENRGFERKFFW